jgi:hypothetical protein
MQLFMLRMLSGRSAKMTKPAAPSLNHGFQHRFALLATRPCEWARRQGEGPAVFRTRSEQSLDGR